MNSRSRLEEYATRFVSDELPTACYLVDADGRFVKYNTRMRDLLALPEDPTTAPAIIEFYCDPEQRTRLLAKFDDLGSDLLQNQPIRVRQLQRDIWIRDNCQRLWYGDHHRQRAVLGYLGCITELHDDESFWAYAPVGIYELDRDDHLVRVNRVVLDLLQYKDTELIGKPIATIYANRSDAESFRRELIAAGTADGGRGKGIVRKRRVELRRKDGKHVVFWANTFKVPVTGARYDGRTGILVDITREDELQQLLDYIPVAAYRVAYVHDPCSDSDKEILEDCNLNFATMFGFRDIESAKGTNVAALWQDWHNDARLFREELIAKERMNLPSRKIVRLQAVDGSRKFLAELHGRLKMSDGRPAARIGAIRDVSQDLSLIEMRDDVNKVLHVYLATLVAVMQVCDLTLHAMHEDPYGDHHGLESADYAPVLSTKAIALREEATRLVAAIERLDPVDLASRVPRIGDMRRILDDLCNFQSSVPKEMWDTSLAQWAMMLDEIASTIPRHVVSRQQLREARACAEELSRACCATLLHQVRERVFDMRVQVLRFRDHVLAPEVRGDSGERALLGVAYIVGSAIEFVGLYAGIRGVRIRRESVEDVFVRGDERYLTIALHNVLHNAVKYSWSRAVGEESVVRVWFEVRAGRIRIRIQNYGVPIEKEEIASGSIFLPGRRGSRAIDRGRPGFGVGLGWTRDIIREHGGTIMVESRAAARGTADEDYSVPFLTTVTIELPTAKEGT